jgi:hypothetical protein
MEITRLFGCSCVCYSLMANNVLMIQATEGIVVAVCLLVDCRVVSGLLDEDIVKDVSLAKREC